MCVRMNNLKASVAQMKRSVIRKNSGIKRKNKKLFWLFGNLNGQK